MSAPAVKPALTTSSGAQAPRVGSGAPNTTPSNTPPTSASSAQKLPSNPVGVSVNVSPVKPPMPPSANHAVSSAVALSLVQEHKPQGNAVPQPPVAVTRTPEKPKDIVSPVVTTTGPKPTSNGVEGSPGKGALTSIQLVAPIAETKKSDDTVSTTTVLNHSADSATPASAAGPISAVVSSPTNDSSPAAIPLSPMVSSSAASVSPSISSGINSQQSLNKSEPVAVAGSGAVTTTSCESIVVASTNSPSNVAPSGMSQSSPKSNTTPTPASNNNSPSKNEPALGSATSGTMGTEIKETVATTSPGSDTISAQTLGDPASGPGPGSTPIAMSGPDVTTKPTPPVPPEVTKTRIEVSKPEFKVATTPRVSKRKRETKPVAEAKAIPGDPNDDRKSKRVRTRTQPYQSPIPELQYIAKIKNLMKGADDKLIVFYKNEFLAVRNAEGSFYVCQAMQNIYKSSTRIRIRWLSQEKKENKDTNVYIPDFYDVTEFDCILTNLELKKLDKNKYELPQEERDRTENILKRALDVEKGVGEKPPVTEEHPDGLDLSLYRDEAQLKKKRNSPKASKKAKKADKDGMAEEGEVEAEVSEESQGDPMTDESEDGEKKKVAKTPKSKAKKKEKAATKASTSATKEKTRAAKDKEGATPKKERTSERGREREASKRKAETPSTSNTSIKNSVAAKSPSEKKAKVTSMPKLSRKAEKAEVTADSSVPTRATKSRSAKNAVTAAAIAPTTLNKTSPLTRTKERERRETSSSGRKKSGKKA